VIKTDSSAIVILFPVLKKKKNKKVPSLTPCAFQEPHQSSLHFTGLLLQRSAPSRCSNFLSPTTWSFPSYQLLAQHGLQRQLWLPPAHPVVTSVLILLDHSVTLSPANQSFIFQHLLSPSGVQAGSFSQVSTQLNCHFWQPWTLANQAQETPRHSHVPLFASTHHHLTSDVFDLLVCLLPACPLRVWALESSLSTVKMCFKWTQQIVKI
jgi:hypothetical protein